MYNIFKNDFYDSKPAPKWAFTVEFFLNEDLNASFDAGFTYDTLTLFDVIGTKSDSEGVSGGVKVQTGIGQIEQWAEKLGKSVSKIPIAHPEGQSVPYRLPGFAKQLPGRYTRSNSITLTFNDNIDRDIRFIIESLIYVHGFNYSNEQSEYLPSMPKALLFDMRVRLYDVEAVNLYDPTEGYDKVSEKGTVQSYYYKGCFFSKIGDENNSYESSDNIRTIDATITYREMNPE